MITTFFFNQLIVFSNSFICLRQYVVFPHAKTLSVGATASLWGPGSPFPMHGTAWHSPAFVIASLRMASSGSFLFIYLLCFGCAGALLLVHELFLVAGSGGYSWLQCLGSSLRQLLLLQSTGSVVVAHELRCPVALGILLDQSPASPALAGRFLSPGPLGSPL